MSLYMQWLDAKTQEDEARERRRSVEDEIIKSLGITQDGDGSQTIDGGDCNVRVTRRMNRRIDAEKLQEIAIEHGVHQHLGDLFRWKPEINKKAWDAASEEVTRPLLDAITTTPGRPSFSIDRKEK